MSDATLEGLATAEGTRRYRDRMVAGGVAEAHFRRAGDLWISSIGFGTYLGTTDDRADEAYRDAAVEAARLGCNFFDTAINYRHQRSERALGEAFALMEAEGIAHRDEIVVATKGGYIPFDGNAPQDPRGYFQERFLSRGLLPADAVVGGMHCMSPRFLDDQIDSSLANLRLDAVDIYYLHNPEGQIPEVGAEEFSRRLRAAFEMLEVKAADSQVGRYGVATWSGLRVPPEEPEHLELELLTRIAAEVGGAEHGFRFLQLPLNLAMPEALVAPSQAGAGERRTSVLEGASRRRLGVVASAALLQGKLGAGLPPEVGEALTDLDSDAQRALQFARSTPGITAALVGMGRIEHVRENLALARLPPASVEEFKRLFRPAT